MKTKPQFEVVETMPDGEAVVRTTGSERYAGIVALDMLRAGCKVSVRPARQTTCLHGKDRRDRSLCGVCGRKHDRSDEQDEDGAPATEDDKRAKEG